MKSDARSEGADAQVRAPARLFLVVGGLGVCDSGKSAGAAIRVIFVSGSSISRATPLMNFSRRVRSAHAQRSTIVSIRVDIDRSVLPQLCGVRLNPLG